MKKPPPCGTGFILQLLMGQKLKQKQMSDSLTVGVLLAVVGGFLDAYTYLLRGHVFANAQTGNIVLLGLSAAQGEFLKASYYLLPILAFLCGVLLTEWIRSRFQNCQAIHWRQLVVAVEMVLLVIVAFLPLGSWDSAANIMISLLCAMQVEGFRKILGNAAATTMCTGNLRSAAERFYLFWTTGDPSRRTESLHYCGIILSFIGGAALGTFCCRLFAGQAVLICCGFLLLAFGMMSFRNSR